MFYTADSLVSSKKCGKFAGDSHAAVVGAMGRTYLLHATKGWVG